MSNNPRLRVRASGFGGSGYVFPELSGGKGKLVTNADGEKLLARVRDDDPKKALVLPGVTTVLKTLEKAALNQWRPDCVAAKAVANIDALINRSQEEGYTYLRFASDEARNDRAEVGTNMHLWIAADLGFGFYPEVESNDAEQMIEQWDTFKFEHDITAHWAERTLANFELGVAGTGDLWLDIDGEEDVLIDIKTSRHTFKEHFAQLVALGDCDSELYEVGGDGTGIWYEGTAKPPKSAALLHIRPEDYDVKGNYIPAFCKLVPLQERKIPAYRALFRSALGAAHAMRELKELGDDVE